MINLKSFIKNFGLLEFLVISSIIYLVSMLIWTASTRASVEAKANWIKQNYLKIVSVLNNEINKCSENPETSTICNKSCSGEWNSKRALEYLIKNIKLNNPYNNKMQLIQSVADPNIPKTPGNIGCFFPSISIFWAIKCLISEWAQVSWIVFIISLNWKLNN